MKRHPIQPMEFDDRGVLRFKENQIVIWMVNELHKLGINLNRIHVECADASKDDWDQFNMLIGYSVSGHPTRSKKNRERIDAAQDAEDLKNPR